MVLWCYGGGAGRSCGAAEIGTRARGAWDRGDGRADYTDYKEAERREDGAPVEAGLRPMR